MKRMLTYLSALVAVAASVTATPKQSAGAVEEKDACSVATLKGSYIFNLSGFTTIGSSTTGPEFPWVVTGIVRFKGDGDVSISYAGAIEGETFTDQIGTGTYTVHPDCSGSMSFTSGDAAGTHLYMAITRDGREGFAVITDAGNTANLQMKKQGEER